MSNPVFYAAAGESPHREKRSRGLCRHCGVKPVNRPRRLCWGCYYTPEIKALYKPLGTHAGRRDIGRGEHPRPLPADPCPHQPGTAGKIAELIRRAEAGEGLWHPGDAVFTPPPEPAA
ncbi:hypothetical protein [Fimbriiglobus ruber]|uniref:Uncharacterized protein n=1 Tax=Fimbriiglobus ruber TaxID=1908690 RepID=A0A225DD44_9BACT|nr:hypothetical protein [Fimbriiglobus ruber]OWK37554.1 hypothetical protein FRUB_06674 [Fimbriiglobus ruber]